MRDHKLISGYFNVKIYKKIPVYAGLEEELAMLPQYLNIY